MIVTYHLSKSHWDPLPKLMRQGLTFLLVSSLGFAAVFVLALVFIDRSGSFIYFRL